MGSLTVKTKLVLPNAGFGHLKQQARAMLPERWIFFLKLLNALGKWFQNWWVSQGSTGSHPAKGWGEGEAAAKSPELHCWRLKSFFFTYLEPVLRGPGSPLQGSPWLQKGKKGKTGTFSFHDKIRSGCFFLTFLHPSLCWGLPGALAECMLKSPLLTPAAV